MDTTTPVIEVEEPLLSAPEVSELVRQMTFQFELDGVCVRLLTEVEAGNIEVKLDEWFNSTSYIPPLTLVGLSGLLVVRK